MEENGIFLSGGVLQFLMSKCSSASNTKLLVAFSNAITGGEKLSIDSTTKTRASEFINCKTKKSIYVLYDDNNLIEEFIKNVHEDFSVPKNRMISFINEIIDKEKIEKLIQSILYVIDNDLAIDEDQPFYINPDGSSVIKEELRRINSVSAASFLVGVTHFILENRNQDNEKGVDTLKEISIKTCNNSQLKPEFLQLIKRDITVHIEEYESILEAKNNNLPASTNISQEETSSQGDQQVNSIKNVFYRSNSVIGETDDFIFDTSYTIIDLNEDMSELSSFDSDKINRKTIFRYRTKYELFLKAGAANKCFAKITASQNEANIVGLTSEDRWNPSKLNRSLSYGSIVATGFFTVERIEDNSYYVQFLLIGDDED